MDISLTEFVDFVLKVGTPKMTHVRSIKNRRPYNPRTDYWKGLRDSLADYHGKGADNAQILLRAVAGHDTSHKGSLYPARMGIYQKFLKKHAPEGWTEPPKGIWGHGELQVRVNPELLYKLDGTPYAIKLYLKKEKVSKRSIDVVNFMMCASLGQLLPPDAKTAVLDLTHDKFYVGESNMENLTPLLKGEADSFIRIWNEL